jgi:hypothetical protein
MESYIVVGGGLAGLTAANALAGPGRRVTLFEQSSHLGGRARTQVDRGYLLNLGPHALYRAGRAFRTLTDWTIPFSGKRPDQNRDSFLVRDGRKFALITGARSLLASGKFSIAEKLEAGLLLMAIRNGGVARGLTVEKWLGKSSRAMREFFSAIIRVSTYSGDLARLDARAAAAQVALALDRGVLYLDGGWETLVRGLEQRAQSLGVEIRCEEPVSSLQDLDASGVVLAVPPRAVERITGRKLPSLRPIQAAVLDIGLRTLPKNAARFALGLDEPLYFSVHTHTAALAPKGAALVHVAKYGKGEREELERFAELLMPGWRAQAEVVRYLPNATVSYALPTTEARPDVDALEMDGVTIAGDWVGPEGMLADAAMASALRAASLVESVVQRRKTQAA